jgi:cellulose synthase/poly-beta-1,6-N-acetylglucosamine synthase-like glycosyltransferase
MERRLRNLLGLDYPREKVQIIVSLDGSTDGTENVVKRYPAIQLVHARQRGKAAAINTAMAHAKGEVIVFADARQTFDSQTLRELAANFADPRIGAVTGELILADHPDVEAGRPLGTYWRYEKVIRALESELHSVVGVTGAIYAIRRELFEVLPEDLILDDVMAPMRIVLGGRRVVFDSAAKAFDTVTCCANAEYNRKVRTLAGNYQLLVRMPALLNPFRNPIFWQLVSHKVTRLFAPYAMAALFVSNALLVDTPVYGVIFAAQSLCYSCALLGYAETRREVGEPLFDAEERKKSA